MQSGCGSELSLKAACCACLTELVVNDANGQQTVQNNGIYLLALLLVEPMSLPNNAAIADNTSADITATVHLQVKLLVNSTFGSWHEDMHTLK